MTATQTQPRRPAGAPTGGQFAGIDRPEADLDLSQAVEHLSADEQDELVGSELVDKAYECVKRWRARLGSGRVSTNAVDERDEMAQETLLRVVDAAANRQVRITGAYVSGTAKNVVREALRGRMPVEDYKALGVLVARRSAREQELGRRLTEAENRALAEEIRENWQSTRARAPRAGYQNEYQNRPLSLDDARDSSTAVPHAGLDGNVHEDDSVAPDSVTAKALAYYALSTKRGLHLARVHAWNVVAENAGAAQVVPGAITTRRRIGIRATIAELDGGAVEAADMWAAGRENEATEALFAPFGDLDEQGREKVVELLRSHRNIASELWSSAVTMADRGRAGDLGLLP